LLVNTKFHYIPFVICKIEYLDLMQFQATKLLLAVAVYLLAENTCSAMLTVVDLLNPTASYSIVSTGVVRDQEVKRAGITALTAPLMNR